MKTFNFILCTAGLLVTFTFSPAYAQKGKGVSRFLKAQANNPAFAQALQHAQAAAAARSGTQLPAAKAIASQAKINSQIQLSRTVATTSRPLYTQLSPQQRLKDLEEFVQTYRRFPKHGSGKSAQESSLRQWIDRFVRTRNKENPIVQRISQIREQYPTAPYKKNGKSPQQWLDELEAFIQEKGHYPLSIKEHPDESRLYYGISNALSRLEADDPIAIRIRQLRKEYPVELVVNRGKKPQQWLAELENFVQKNGRYPSSNKQIPEEQSIYQGVASALNYLPIDDPIALRMRQLSNQYPRTLSVSSNNRSAPQRTLDELEKFIQTHGRYPKQILSDEEARLYARARALLTTSPVDDPLAVRVRQLREQYPPAVRPKTPQQWLDELKAFIHENERYPKQTVSVKERSLYSAAGRLIQKLGKDDPIAQEILQLHKKYAPTSRGLTPQERLNELEAFIRENGRYPSQANPGKEQHLYVNLNALVKRIGKEHPVAARILQLRQDYLPDDRNKTPWQWLENLETFINKNGRYPSQKELGKEHFLYANIQKLLTRLGEDHPISIRILQLRQEYFTEQ